MKKNISKVLMMLAIFYLNFANAQNKNSTLSGKVISFEESFGLEGVSIEVKETKKYSGTQADGTFSIIVSPEDKILVFSLQGYQTVELAIPSKDGYEVILKRNGNYAAIKISQDFHTKNNKVAIAPGYCEVE